MRRETNLPLSIVRDTLEYAEARTLLAEKLSLKKHLRNLNMELKLLQRLSSEAVELAKIDTGMEKDTPE